MVGHPVVGEHVRQGVVQGLHVGVELFLQVTGKEAEVLTCFNRRAGHDDAPHLLLLEGLHGQGHRRVGLARTRRTDGKDHVVVPDGVHELALVGRPGRHPQSSRTIYQGVILGSGLFQGDAIVPHEPLHVILRQGSIALHVPDQEVPLGRESIEVSLGAHGLDLRSATDQLQLRKEGFQLREPAVADPEEFQGRNVWKLKCAF